jgi:WD40 repeat protein
LKQITLQGFAGDVTQQDTTAVVAEVAHWRQHGKYVVQVVWSPCGRYLCTVSHDKTVGIYRDR